MTRARGADGALPWTARRRTRASLGLLVAVLAAGCAAPAVQSPTPGPEGGWLVPLTQGQAYVWGHPYSVLRVELAYAEGYAPDPRALEALAIELERATDKQRIDFARPIELRGAEYRDRERNWSLAEAMALADATFTPFGPQGHGANDTALLRVLYLNGYVYSDARELGGLSLPSLALVLPDRFYEFLPEPLRALGLPLDDWGRWRIERWMLIHEIGHNLGLVDLDVPMVTPRKSDDHRPHSTSEASVMYMWARTPAAWREFEDGKELPYTFDEYDLADFAAFQEEGRRAAAR